MHRVPPAEVTVRYSGSAEWQSIPWEEFERDSRESVEWLREDSARSVQRGDVFSRECVPCRQINPRERSVAVQCGHLVCSDCSASATKCPICKIATSFLRIYEESTRECPICCEIPLQRTYFNPCGHVVCMACIVELRLVAVRNSAAFRCSYCQTSAVSGGFEPLDEELIQEEIKRREQDTILERKKNKEVVLRQKDNRYGERSSESKETKKRKKQKKEARYRLRREVEIEASTKSLWHGQQLERKNHSRSFTNKNTYRSNKGMIRVNQPIKR